MRGEHGVDHLLLCGDSTFPVSWAIFFMGWVSTSDLYLIINPKKLQIRFMREFFTNVPIPSIFSQRVFVSSGMNFSGEIC